MFRLNAPVVIRVIVKKYEQMLLFTAMRTHIIGGQSLVRIVPPFLPHHRCSATRDFSPPSRFKRCHLDVQGLFHQYLLSSARHNPH